MAQRRFFIIFGLFWTAITSTFLVDLGYGVINQLRSLSFAQTTAIIDSIKRTENNGDDPTTYGISVAYHYSVGGNNYRSTRLRYNAGSSSDAWAAGILRRMPPGARVPLFYNARNPGDAVLIRGLEGSDLFFMQFMTPFTAVMVVLWIIVGRSFRRPRAFLGLNVTDAGPVTRIRPARWLPLFVAGIALALAAFFAIFPVAFLFGGFHPSLPVAETSWAIIIAIALTGGVVANLRIRTGRYDIVLDDQRRILFAKGKQIAYGAVTKVALATRVRKSSDGESTTYQIWVHYHDGQRPGGIKVMQWSELLPDAQRFATWLSLRLGVPVDPPELTVPA